MKKLVSLMTVWLSEIGVVKLLDLGILVGFSDLADIVRAVDTLCSFRAYIYGILNVRGLNGLTASGNASAGAAHNFYELIIGFSVPDFLHNYIRVFDSVSHCYLNGFACDFDLSALDSLDASDLFEFYFSSGFPSRTSLTVLRAASITPPVAPKIRPAVEPEKLSYLLSLRHLKRIPERLMNLASSLVVRTASMS